MSVFSFLTRSVHIRSRCPSNLRTVFAWCTKQNGAPDVTRWPPEPHTVRQATFQLHNNTQTQRILLCKDKGCSLAYSTKSNSLALHFENFSTNTGCFKKSFTTLKAYSLYSWTKMTKKEAFTSSKTVHPLITLEKCASISTPVSQVGG